MENKGYEKTNMLKILTEVINEIGDLTNIGEFEYKIKSTGGEFKTDEGHRVNVNLSKWPKALHKNFKFPPVVEIDNSPIYNVGYTVEGEGSQFIKSNYRNLIKIIKTVSLIVKHHVESLDNQDPIFTLFSEGKTGKGHEDSQKQVLYKEILSKNLPQNYRLGFAEYVPLNAKFIYASKIK